MLSSQLSALSSPTSTFRPGPHPADEPGPAGGDATGVREGVLGGAGLRGNTGQGESWGQGRSFVHTWCDKDKPVPSLRELLKSSRLPVPHGGCFRSAKAKLLFCPSDQLPVNTTGVDGAPALMQCCPGGFSSLPFSKGQGSDVK